MYNTLDTRNTARLYMINRGWFSPDYDLGDGANCYGKLSYSSISRRQARAESATSTWIFNYDGFFSRTISITDEKGTFIGKTTRDWFGRQWQLSLQTGFGAGFYRSSLFPIGYSWSSEGFGKIMHIKCTPFNLKSTIHIGQSMTPPALIPLLTLLGMHLVILARRRRAAH